MLGGPEEMPHLLDHCTQPGGLSSELLHGAIEFFFPRLASLGHGAHRGPDEIRKAWRAMFGAEVLQPEILVVGETKTDEASSAIHRNSSFPSQEERSGTGFRLSQSYVFPAPGRNQVADLLTRPSSFKRRNGSLDLMTPENGLVIE